MFWLMMDRNSTDFDAGVGKLYRKGTGKFDKYEGVECYTPLLFYLTEKVHFKKLNANLKMIDKI